MELEYELTNIAGIGESTKDKLISAGINSVDQLAALTPDELAKVKGFGPATSRKIIENAQEFTKHNGGGTPDAVLNEPIYEEQPASVSGKASDAKNNNMKLDYYSILAEEEPLEAPFQDETEVQFQEFEEVEQQSSVKNEEQTFSASSNVHDNIQGFQSINQPDSAIEEIETFIENELTIQKPKKKPFQEAFIPYEDEGYDKLNGEMLSKEEVIQVKKAIVQRFKKLGYSILDKQSNLLRGISKDIDILAYKILDVDDSVGTFAFFPVKISHLRGILLISEEHIIYKPTNMAVEVSKESLVSAQKEVFENITTGGILFQLLRKKLAKKTLSIRKTKDGTPLFIAANQKEYKTVIHPVLVSISEPAFLEKPAMFSYQRNINLHVIGYEAIKALVKFLEKKVALRESFFSPENTIIRYERSFKRMKDDFQKYSVPFLLFGAIFAFIMLLQNIILLATFTNLGVAVLFIYGFAMWFVYNTFIKTQKTIKADYQTPYYLKPVQIDEVDVYSIKDNMSAHELDQMLYEWFGKSCEFSCVSEIETEKALEDQEDIEVYNIPLRKERNITTVSQYEREETVIEAYNSLESKEIDIETKGSNESKEKSMKGQMISKYSAFLED